MYIGRDAASSAVLHSTHQRNVFRMTEKLRELSRSGSKLIGAAAAGNSRANGFNDHSNVEFATTTSLFFGVVSAVQIAIDVTCNANFCHAESVELS